MSGSVSPLAPKTYAEMPPVSGVRMATAAAGIKYKNRTDVLMMIFDRPAAVAGVFTRSKCPSAPVDFCRANLPGGVARAVVVNSGTFNTSGGNGNGTANGLDAMLTINGQQVVAAGAGLQGRGDGVAVPANLLVQHLPVAAAGHPFHQQRLGGHVRQRFGDIPLDDAGVDDQPAGQVQRQPQDAVLISRFDRDGHGLTSGVPRPTAIIPGAPGAQV